MCDLINWSNINQPKAYITNCLYDTFEIADMQTSRSAINFFLVAFVALFCHQLVDAAYRKCEGECFGQNPCTHKSTDTSGKVTEGRCKSSDDCTGVTSCGSCWSVCRGRKWGGYGNRGTSDGTDSYGGEDYSLPDVDYVKPPGGRCCKRRKRRVKRSLPLEKNQRLHKRSAYTPPSNSDITCAFECQKDGQCTHRLEGPMGGHQSGSCIRKGKTRKL